jgi:hemoglobin
VRAAPGPPPRSRPAPRRSRRRGPAPARAGRRSTGCRRDSRLVRAFYGRALEDPIIGWLFTDVARLDVEAHVPQIASFWATILLGERGYDGNPFPPHLEIHEQVGLTAGHFGRWLALWNDTLDELFAGERTELAKAHAMRVAQAFHRRLQAFPSGRDAAPAAGLVVTRHGPAD